MSIKRRKEYLKIPNSIKFEDIKNLFDPSIIIRLYDKNEVNFLSYYRNIISDGIVTIDNNGDITKDIFYPYMVNDNIVNSIKLSSEENTVLIKLDIDNIYNHPVWIS